VAPVNMRVDSRTASGSQAEATGEARSQRSSCVSMLYHTFFRRTAIISQRTLSNRTIIGGHRGQPRACSATLREEGNSVSADNEPHASW